MAELIFKLIDDLILAVHGARPPSSSEWDSYLKEHQRLASEKRKVSILVVTEGGGPNSAQRAALKELVASDLRTAIVTGSVAVRGIVTAFNWLGWSSMQAFAPHEMDGALRLVGASHRKDAVLAELKRMQESLAGRSNGTHAA
jgi:hypothetical protein